MSVPHPNLRLYMTRQELDGLPQYAVPPGFRLRWFRPGDEFEWLRIQAAADAYTRVTPDLFKSYFGSDSAVLERRQCFLVGEGGRCVGTATAWEDLCFEGGLWGRVHWVAVLPEFQERGLSRPLMTAVCNRLRELGHGRAYLVTGPNRLPAIRLYLSFGFRAHARSAEEAAMWRKVGQGMGMEDGGLGETAPPGSAW